MTQDITSLLSELTTEAGVVTPETSGIGQQVVHHLDDGSGAFVQELNTAEQAGDLAEHMEDIAERADELAKTDDVVIAQVSAESLHRELHIVARAKHIRLNDDSFESAVSDVARLKGIARDARGHADSALAVRAQVLDFSPEGKLMEFLRRDRSRLEAANKELDDAIHMLTPAAIKLKDSGVFLAHDGFRRFFTVEGHEINDLEAAFTKQDHILEKAHAAVVAGLNEVDGLAKKLLGAGVKSGIESLRGGKHFSGLSGLASPKGGLLGNFSLTEVAKPGSIPGLSVPVYDRKNEHSFSKMGLVKGVGVGAWGLFIGAVRHAAISAAIGKDGHQYAHVANNAVKGVSDASSVRQGISKYDEHVNTSGKKTVASYPELVKISNGVKGYSKFTSARVNLDDFESTLKSARSNTETLSAEEKADLKKICSALEDAAARIMRLESAIYNQAVYTTTMIAQVITATVNKIN